MYSGLATRAQAYETKFMFNSNENGISTAHNIKVLKNKVQLNLS